MNNNLSFLRYLKYSNIKDRSILHKWESFITESQWWDKEQVNNFQWGKVKLLLDYAFENIPYYRELFTDLGGTPHDIKSWDDFMKIPYLTKEIVRERSIDLISMKISKSRLKHYTTGGSTGSPLGFFRKQEDEVISRAFMLSQWSRVGYKETSRRVILRAEPIRNNKLYEKFRFSNDWLLSSYHISKVYIAKYVEFLNHIKPEFFHVHPSTFYNFTLVLLKSNLRLSFDPTAILCGSEIIYDYQRELFERTYNSRVYSWLGLAEGTIMAGECEYSRSLHIWPQYSYVELVDENGLSVKEKGRSGSIIGTTLRSLETPFIRYRSGDLAVYESDRCDLCGRQHTLLGSIEGREQAVIINADGSKSAAHSIPHLIVHKSKAFDSIKLIQIVQNTKGKIVLRLDTTSDYNDKDETEIRDIINSSFNLSSIDFEYTDVFVKSKSGKHIFFIQNIKE
mgnify:CR=1 FL=1